MGYGRLLPPHPGPLPRGEGESFPAYRRSDCFSTVTRWNCNHDERSTDSAASSSLSPGEGAGVGGKETSNHFEASIRQPQTASQFSHKAHNFTIPPRARGPSG